MLKGESILGKFSQSLIFFHLLPNTFVYNFLYINWKQIEPNVNLKKHQTGVYYPGMKVFTNLQPTIKNLNDINILKPALKGYLLSQSFYSV